MASLIKLNYDSNYEYRWSVDGNKYGDKYQVYVLPGHYDDKLKADGWEEVLCVNGGLFYKYENDYFACGVEFSRGVNNQDPSMNAVSQYNGAMVLCCTYDGRLEFNLQSDVVWSLDQYYGVVTGIGILKDGAACSWGHSEFSSQYKQVSGRTIIGEYPDGTYASYSFAGTTGSSGMTGAQVTSKCKELGFKNAIMLDGGGSVARRYNGKYEIQTSRAVKNAVLLYRKKKINSTPQQPEQPNVPSNPSDNTDELNSKINELNEKINSLNSQIIKLNEDLTTSDKKVEELTTKLNKINEILQN